MVHYNTSLYRLDYNSQQPVEILPWQYKAYNGMQ